LGGGKTRIDHHDDDGGTPLERVICLFVGVIVVNKALRWLNFWADTSLEDVR